MKINILKNGVVTNSGPDQEWLDKQLAMGNFGDPFSFEVEYIDDTEELAREAANVEAMTFLQSTDWKILRHRDQQDLGLPTSLGADEFQELLRQRQMAREAIIND